LVNRKWHSSIHDVQTFRDTDCAIDHHLVVAKVREKLSAYKRAAQKFGAKNVNIEKLNKLEAT
jgi:nitrate/TMAO reductase-like tetraheme cytochrome c subunit